MKKKRLISFILVVLILLSATPAMALVTPPPSDWAAAEVDEANAAGLLTPCAARNFQAPLTRAEFCELVVNMVERVLGEPLPVPAQNPFHDTTDLNILKAWNFQIVNGVTETRFAPDNNITRQQLVTMLIRAIRGIERELDRNFLLAPAPTLPFNDTNRIADYAIEAVRLAYSNGIMHGDTVGNFNPVNPISSQECILVIIRTYNRLETALAAGRTAAQLLDMAYNRIHIGFAYGDAAVGVTRNIVLPTTLPTLGATVAWQSSHPQTISPQGVVNTGATPQTVTLTATIQVQGQTSTKTFELTTSPLTGDQLLLANAYATLDIIYLTEGNHAGFVTGRIGLPERVLGLPVTWQSLNTAVVTHTGHVTVPTTSDARNVTLTAQITLGTQTRTKQFNLSVFNPALAAVGVSLHNVRLGMTLAEINQAMGVPTRVINAGGPEVWRLYHTNYNNFIAVAFIGNNVAAVYSMAPNVVNQLRDASDRVVTVGQADAMPGLRAVSFTDGGAIYALMIFDPNTVIGSSPTAAGGNRPLASDGQEQLLFEFVNAFRVRNNLSVLEWSPGFGAPARAHSLEMGTHNILSVTSPVTNQTLEQRVTAAGAGLLVHGNVLRGNGDALWFFNQMLIQPAMRAHVLANDVSIFGAGFSIGHATAAATYGVYVTYMFGTAQRHASTLSVSAFDRQITNSPLSMPGTHTLVMGVNETLTLTAETDITGASVGWQVTGGNVAGMRVHGNSFDVTAMGTPGTIVVTVSTDSGQHTSIVHTITIQVVSVDIHVAPHTTLMTGLTLGAATNVIGVPLLDIPAAVWTSGSPTLVQIHNQTGVITRGSAAAAVTQRQVPITATLTWNTQTHLGEARGTVNIIVPANS